MTSSIVSMTQIRRKSWSRWYSLIFLLWVLVLTSCAGNPQVGAGTVVPAANNQPVASAISNPSDIDDPNKIVQAFVDALERSDRDGMLALVSNDLPSPIERVSKLLDSWKRASEPALSEGTDRLGARQALDVGNVRVQGTTATVDIAARHEAGTLVLTLLLRSDGKNWLVTDWNTDTRDINLPTPTVPGLR